MNSLSIILKVKSLIEVLEKCDPEAGVMVADNGVLRRAVYVGEDRAAKGMVGWVEGKNGRKVVVIE